MIHRLLFGAPKTRRETISPLQSFDEGYKLGRNEAEYKWMMQLFDLAKEVEDRGISDLLAKAASDPKPRLRPAEPFEDAS